MSAQCPTCREPVRELMRVYNLTMESGECIICLEPASEICIFVPCGHPVCAGCSRQWVARLHHPLRVPGGPAAPEEEEEDLDAERRRWWYEFGDQRGDDSDSAQSVDEGSVVSELAPPDIAGWAPMPFASAPPPFLEPEPPAVEPTMPPPRAPTLGEAFLFTGRLVSWVRLYRFGSKIVLVWADSGLLCQGGDHVVRPTGIAGYLVKYHVAGERANRKWFLEAEVHDV